jgi:hypothetical protein
MKFNKVFHYFDIHYSLFEILRFKTKFAWRIEQEEFASTLPGSHAPGWEREIKNLSVLCELCGKIISAIAQHKSVQPARTDFTALATS